jgi:hypothetical protein
MRERGLGLSDAQERLHGGDQHGRLDGLREIDVGAMLQPTYLIGGSDRGIRNLKNLNARQRRVPFPQTPAYFKALMSGRFTSRHDEIGKLFRCQFERFGRRRLRRPRSRVFRSALDETPALRRRRRESSRVLTQAARPGKLRIARGGCASRAFDNTGSVRPEVAPSATVGT